MAGLFFLKKGPKNKEEETEETNEDTVSEEDCFIKFGEEVDLHHFHPRDTKLVVMEFLEQAVEEGLSPLRIVHGKGKSQKKMVVHKILTTDNRVESFKDDGANWGATIVFLKSELFSGKGDV